MNFGNKLSYGSTVFATLSRALSEMTNWYFLQKVLNHRA